MNDGPAFYASTGSVGGDLLAILHPPYTAWHLSYVVIGASLATTPSLSRLGWTLLVFFLSVGIAAHALDEVKGRPLSTALSDRALWYLAIGALGFAGVLIAIGSLQLSPWIWAWATVGLFLAVGYPLEWPSFLHTDLGFGLAWGAFPALAGYWMQEEALSVGAVIVAAFATLFSLAQRSLSTPARFVRRNTTSAIAEFDGTTWGRSALLSSWERPLHLLAWAVVVLAAGLLLTRI